MKPQSEIVHTVKCAGCGAMKQKSNNWWQIHLEEGKLVLEPMAKNFLDLNGMWFLCGFECVHTMFNEYMNDMMTKPETKINGMVVVGGRE